MNKIESTENENTFGDFLWVHLRGFLFLALTLCAIIATLNMSIHYNNEIIKSNIDSLKFCPHCGEDLSH